MRNRLRILGLVEHPVPLVGGAQITLAVLLGHLQREFGHHCALHGLSATPGVLIRYGVRLRGMRDWEELVDGVRRFRPDVLLSSLEHSIFAAAIAERYGIPHVIWVQSFELSPPTPSEAAAWRVRRDRVYPSASERHAALTGAALVLANSTFIQKRLLHREHTPSHVVYPVFDRRDCAAGVVATTSTAVLGVCGYGHKGADIFLTLAEQMPERQFILAGRAIDPWRARAHALSNITVRPFGPARDLLADAGVVLVPSQWPEPFGRVAIEAMAAGIPVIASATGGLPECCGGAARLVRRFRSAEAWREALDVHAHDASDVPARARRGRRQAERFQTGRSLVIAERLIRRAAQHRRPVWPSTPLVVLAGNREARSAFALINTEWSRTRGRHAATLVSHTPAQADATLADVHVRHDFSQPFETWTPPHTGHLAAVRTWDFGPYPPSWVKTIVDHYDQLWVYTQWTRRHAILSGIPRDRVKVIPPGVDTRVFTPQGRSHQWDGPSRFTFLFVGAPISRKGIDILLAAYLRAFTKQDPVRLVIKTHADDLFYRGVDSRAALRAAASNRRGPEVRLIDQFLSAPRLAALY
ncbi:MAG: glycosyltransferase, partial [Vicinamibacterales bacterium]